MGKSKLIFWTITAQEWTGNFQQINSRGYPVSFAEDTMLQTVIKSSANSLPIITPASVITDRALGKWATTISIEESYLLPAGTVYMETVANTNNGSVWSIIYAAQMKVVYGAVLNPTMTELENLFHDFTAKMFGFDIDNVDPAVANAAQEAAATAIRIAWPTQGAPPWKITDDKAFLKLTFEDNDYTKQREYSYQRKTNLLATQVMEMTNCLRVAWTFYGPNSSANAFRVFSMLGNPALTLSLEQNKVFLIPDIKSPVRAPELFSGQYWERSDVYATFNVHIRLLQDVPYLLEAEISASSDNANLSSSYIDIVTDT